MSNHKSAEASERPAAEGPFARIGAEVDNLLRSLIPSDEVTLHFTNARVEILKGMRALIDARIERLSREGQKGVSITVE